jgi:hypothetical protein
MGRDPTGMPPALVFGYGSLLEGAAGTPCRLPGHRRRFGVAMDNRRTIPGYKYYLDAATGERPAVFVAFLDIVEDPGSAVEGLSFEVDAAALAALDDRERNYRRVEVDGRLWAYAGLPTPGSPRRGSATRAPPLRGGRWSRARTWKACVRASRPTALSSTSRPMCPSWISCGSMCRPTSTALDRRGDLPRAVSYSGSA